MGDCRLEAKPSQFTQPNVRDPGQLSLAIPPWVGAMSTGKSWGENRHTVRCISPVSMVKV